MRFLLPLLMATAAMAQPAPPAPAIPAAPVSAPAAALPRVVLDTAAGPVTLEVDTVRAPKTAANFLRYVREKRFDGTGFYRAMKVGDSAGLVQGGTRGDRKRVLPPVAHEPTSATGLSNTDGAVAMARAEPGSADGDFFIVVGDLSGLDAGRQDAAGFAVFGRVVDGMDRVKTMLTAPTSPTEGVGVMRGQMLKPVIAIRSAKRLPPGR
jgi:peptidyl-prolyl cis-trans isomerase A (cyclophilin A)